MEGRTKILLGRSVKRVEARKNVLRAFEAAQVDLGRALVVLEEMVNEARALAPCRTKVRSSCEMFVVKRARQKN